MYKKNDDVCRNIIKEYLEILGAGISNLTMLFDPKVIIIGGEVNNILANEMHQLKEFIYKDNIFLDENICKIELTKFKDSYLLGAARLVIEEFLKIR